MAVLCCAVLRCVENTETTSSKGSALVGFQSAMEYTLDMQCMCKVRKSD